MGRLDCSALYLTQRDCERFFAPLGVDDVTVAWWHLDNPVSTDGTLILEVPEDSSVEASVPEPKVAAPADSSKPRTPIPAPDTGTGANMRSSPFVDVSAPGVLVDLGPVEDDDNTPSISVRRRFFFL